MTKDEALRMALKTLRQCLSYGGFCKKSGCERENVRSGFATNPIGYTGFFCGTRNPATNDCFWRCRILEADNTTFLVETEDGHKGRIPRKEFTPMAMIVG